MKYKYQPTYINKNSWKRTVKEQRLKVNDVLIDNPSLKHYLPELFAKAYIKAITLAQTETSITKNAFPKESEWTILQVLDDEFYPS